MKSVGKSLFTLISVVLKIIDCPILEPMIIAGSSSGCEFAKNRYKKPPVRASDEARRRVSFIEV